MTSVKVSKMLTHLTGVAALCSRNTVSLLILEADGDLTLVLTGHVQRQCKTVTHCQLIPILL